MSDLQISRTIAEVRRATTDRKGAPMGFVPTMGALHAGHGSLIQRARSECETVVVSIFVNPLQFGPGEDYENYPRDLEADIFRAGQAGADIVFLPTSAELTDDGLSTTVTVAKISERLCGLQRPGHFSGVAIVVVKLFNIVHPDRAYFGEKDWQQLQLVRRLTADLSYPIEIIGVETVREEDGLALSSRNRYLNASERETAQRLPRALRAAAGLIEAGETDAREVALSFRETIATGQELRLEYFSICLPDTLEPVDAIQGKTLLAAAIRVGKTRLIDNILVSP